MKDCRSVPKDGFNEGRLAPAFNLLGIDPETLSVDDYRPFPVVGEGQGFGRHSH